MVAHRKVDGSATVGWGKSAAGVGVIVRGQVGWSSLNTVKALSGVGPNEGGGG